MSGFCGNCGTPLAEGAKVCGQCGVPVPGSGTAAAFRYEDPEKKAKTKKTIQLVAVLAVVVVIAIIAVNVISGFVGYKGAVRKVMNAYEDYDLDTIVSLSSDLYFCMADEDYAEDYFGGIISRDLDHFEDEVGHKYKLSYKITDHYEMSEHKYQNLLDDLSWHEDFDADIISKVMIVELDVTAKEGRDSTTMKLELTLTKEDGDWKLLYIE